MEWRRITSPYTTRPHEASEKGLIRSQMVLQILWRKSLGVGKGEGSVDRVGQLSYH